MAAGAAVLRTGHEEGHVSAGQRDARKGRPFVFSPDAKAGSNVRQGARTAENQLRSALAWAFPRCNPVDAASGSLWNGTISNRLSALSFCLTLVVFIELKSNKGRSVRAPGKEPISSTPYPPPHNGNMGSVPGFHQPGRRPRSLRIPLPSFWQSCHILPACTRLSTETTKT